MRNFVLTSESQTRGHPDKLCDQISDAMVDACLASDPEGGITAECAVASGVVFLSIRHRRPLRFDPAALARRVLAEAAAPGDDLPERATVMLDAVETPELPGRAGAEVASHMTTAFGHACRHTDERIPLAIWAAHRLSARLDALADVGAPAWLGRDAQAQVAIRFAERKPAAYEAIALTFAAASEPPPHAEAVAALLRSEVAAPALERSALQGSTLAPTESLRLIVQPRPGPGGPRSHAGLTGRKTAADSYGAFCRHASSALSGKDPSRIERLAAYAARQAALTVLAAGLADECEVQLSYAPGEAAPASLEVDSFGAGRLPDAEISRRLRAAMDFRVGAILERLDLWRLPESRDGRFYRDLATYGHFGRLDLAPPWELTPDADLLAVG